MQHARMSGIGASASYRGYRLQALYTLYRVLEGGEHFIFQLEGFEDLDVLSSEGKLLELVQVKAKDENLTISSLEPGKKDAFFRRVLNRHSSSSNAQEKVVSFGPFGPEILDAWAKDGPRREEHITTLAGHKYTRDQVLDLISRIKLVREEEKNIEQAVLARLRESMLGIDSKAAFELLHAWLYVKAEAKARISHKDIIERINSVGKFIAERSAYHEEWCRSIVPLEIDQKLNTHALRDEFYRGIAARYEHIVAGVDLPREERIEQIHEAFKSARVVIVRGNSGQGKSALAYRYLHTHVLNQWRYEIPLIQDSMHARSIALALRGKMNAVEVPLFVYIDVRPGNTAWIELVQALSRYPQAHVLVTIREEDWNRTSVSGHEFDFREIELRFDEGEARGIYGALVERQKLPHVLAFEDAWTGFGKTGPLLEFSYFLVQNESLRDRLKQQVGELRNEVRLRRLMPEELQLLRCVSVASANGARLDLKILARELELPEPGASVQRFEREYFLRKSGDGRYVEGLHPIRSELLCDLLTDGVFEPWIHGAEIAVRSMVDEDLEFFLLHTFSRRRKDLTALIEVLMNFHSRTWTGMAGILRALIWVCVRDYVDRNEAVIREAYEHFGNGWYAALMPDIGNMEAIAPGVVQSIFGPLHELIPDEVLQRVTALQSRLSPAHEALELVRLWFSSCACPPIAPGSALDWKGVGEILFWAGHLGLPTALQLRPQATEIQRAMVDMPLDVVADLVQALHLLRDDEALRLLDEKRPLWVERLQREMLIPVLEDDGETIRAHFLLDPEEMAGLKTPTPEQNPSTNFFFRETSARVNLLRRLFPSRSVIATQGYGQSSLGIELPFDETTKAIPAKNLTPANLVRVNAWFIRLGEYLFRGETWADYAQRIMEIRRQNLEVVEDLISTLSCYFRKTGPVVIELEGISEDRWSAAQKGRDRQPLLPKVAVDEWGFITEGMSEDRQDNVPKPQIADVRLALRCHKPYLDAMRAYLGGLYNFFFQAPESFYFGIKRGMNTEARNTIDRIVEEKTQTRDPGHLSTHNLSNSLKALPSFHREFRARFSSIVPAGDLEQLEIGESGRLLRLFCLWHFFVKHSDRGAIKQPSQYVAKLFLDAKNQVRRGLQSRLKGLKARGLRTSMHGLDGALISDADLSICFDVDNATNISIGMILVYHAIIEAFPHGHDLSLAHYGILFGCPMIRVIPLVRGRSLSLSGWQFSALTLIGEPPNPQSEPLLFAMHPLPEKVCTELGIQKWEHPRLDMMSRVLETSSQLAILLGHASSLKTLSESSDREMEVLQRYASAQGSRIDKARDEVQMAFSAIISCIQASIHDQDRRYHLKQVLDLLVTAAERIELQHLSDRITFTAAGEWAESIRSALPLIGEASLHWANDVLDELDAQRHSAQNA